MRTNRLTSKLAAFFLLLTAFLAEVNGQQKYSTVIAGGNVYNIPSTLTIEQDGFPTLRMTARYRSEGFEAPFYYMIKFAFPLFKNRWQLQFIHHKLILDNPPGEIQHFEVTHGFNLLTLNMQKSLRRYYALLGLGIVLPHSESTIRNQKIDATDGILSTEYEIDAPVVILGLGRQFQISRRLFLLLEGQFIVGRATVDIAGGEADVVSLGLHGIMGLGWHF